MLPCLMDLQEPNPYISIECLPCRPPKTYIVLEFWNLNRLFSSCPAILPRCAWCSLRLAMASSSLWFAICLSVRRGGRIGDHGRGVRAQDWVSKGRERRSNALARRGSHPKHRFSRFWTRSLFQVAVSRGFLDYGQGCVYSAAHAIVDPEDSLGCCCSNS